MALAFAVVACSHPDSSPPKEPPPAPTSDEAIPVGPLGGKLLGESFTVKSARYYVDQRPGYQKTVLELYGVDAPTPCEDLTPVKPPTVWLRHDGPERVEAGKTSIGLDAKAPWALHYQIQKNGRWVGNGDANALFVVTAVDSDMKVHGELSGCFRDATGSCISGRFTANYCRIWIDSPVRGADGMEREPDVMPKAPPVPASAAPSASAAPAGSAMEPRR